MQGISTTVLLFSRPVTGKNTERTRGWVSLPVEAGGSLGLFSLMMVSRIRNPEGISGFQARWLSGCSFYHLCCRRCVLREEPPPDCAVVFVAPFLIHSWLHQERRLVVWFGMSLNSPRSTKNVVLPSRTRGLNRNWPFSTHGAVVFIVIVWFFCAIFFPLSHKQGIFIRRTAAYGMVFLNCKILSISLETVLVQNPFRLAIIV